MNHFGTVNLDSDRLILRKFNKNDSIDMFNNWGSDSKVTEFLSWSPHREYKESEEVIANWIDKYDEQNTYNWAIELKETQEVIGNIVVVKLEDSNSSCEIGYCIGSKYWNKGIATEALKEVIKYLFSRIKVNRISARHDILNAASGEVMKKCNMKHEGILREVKYKNNRFCTMSVYSILKTEWELEVENNY